MNPSKINREKILKKFNITSDEPPEEKIFKEPNLEQSSSPNIELDLNLSVNEISNPDHHISRNILSKLPSLLKYKKIVNNKYFHKISEILNTNEPNFIINKPINICIFNIYKQKDIAPAILFLLYKTNDSLSFPQFTTTTNLDNSLEKKLDSIFANYKTKPQYIGYKEYDNMLYVVYEYKELYNVSEIKKKSLWWWTTVSEIVNYKKILNFEIKNYVSKFFIQNLFFMLFRP